MDGWEIMLVSCLWKGGRACQSSGYGWVGGGSYTPMNSLFGKTCIGISKTFYYISSCILVKCMGLWVGL